MDLRVLPQASGLSDYLQSSTKRGDWLLALKRELTTSVIQSCSKGATFSHATKRDSKQSHQQNKKIGMQFIEALVYYVLE